MCISISNEEERGRLWTNAPAATQISHDRARRPWATDTHVPIAGSELGSEVCVLLLLLLLSRDQDRAFGNFRAMMRLLPPTPDAPRRRDSV